MPKKLEVNAAGSIVNLSGQVTRPYYNLSILDYLNKYLNKIEYSFGTLALSRWFIPGIGFLII